MSIAERIRTAGPIEIVAMREEIANYIDEIRMALVQYQDDLNYPPTKDSLTRRFDMIDKLMVRK